MHRRVRLICRVLRAVGRAGTISLFLAAAALPRGAGALTPTAAKPAVAATAPAGGSGTVRATVVLRARHTVQGGQRRRNARAHPRS